MYTVAFQFDCYLDDNGISYLKDYSWWFELVKEIASRADTFEIRCWPDEPGAIATGQRFGKQMENNHTTELVFKGSITEEFLCHVFKDGCNEKGRLKWFTVHFYQGEELLFESGHYGTEPIVFVKTKEEIQQLKEWSKQHPIITRVDVFE